MAALLERHDIVEIIDGSRFIIVEVHPHRPANPYVAIKERGNGAKYKLGYKHKPHKVGRVSNDHWLLTETAFRDFNRLGSNAKQMLRDALSGDDNATKTILGMLD